MKKSYALLLLGALLWVSGPVCAQDEEPPAAIAQNAVQDTGSTHQVTSRDPFPFTRSNQLKRDDPDYNPKYSHWIPTTEVVATNGLLWAFDRYAADDSFSHISLHTVGNNFSNGWVWDTDDFPTNFSLHPYLGSAYFNCGRANGYDFYESAAFSFGGSLMWEMFMENTKPSYNDLINTTFSGIFLGEVEYRLSSKILDDRKSGGQRVLREIVGTIIDPERGFNRLLQGKMFRVVPQEIYQKESLHLTIGIGARRIDRSSNLGLEPLKTGVLNFNISYGDPYEARARKPFDYFKIRADLTSGDLEHIARSVTGDGFLFGKNASNGVLTGGFQHYDYWNTDSFEIGTIGLGGGLLSQTPIFKNGTFQNEFHLAAVPLAASNARKGNLDTQNPGFHNYTYSAGAELKYGGVLNFSRLKFEADYYLYWLHSFIGKPGDNLIGILRPRASLKVYGAIHAGYEYLLYTRSDSNGQGPNIHVNRDEQRIYVLFDFE